MTGEQRGCPLDADEHDRPNPALVQSAATLKELGAGVVELTVAVHLGRPLEAVPLTTDWIDDVDLHHNVSGFDIGHRLMGMHVSEHQVSLVPTAIVPLGDRFAVPS